MYCPLLTASGSRNSNRHWNDGSNSERATVDELQPKSSRQSAAVDLAYLIPVRSWALWRSGQHHERLGANEVCVEPSAEAVHDRCLIPHRREEVKDEANGNRKTATKLANASMICLRWTRTSPFDLDPEGDRELLQIRHGGCLEVDRVPRPLGAEQNAGVEVANDRLGKVLFKRAVDQRAQVHAEEVVVLVPSHNFVNANAIGRQQANKWDDASSRSPAKMQSC